jgi:hypothetical protein
VTKRRNVHGRDWMEERAAQVAVLRTMFTDEELQPRRPRPWRRHMTPSPDGLPAAYERAITLLTAARSGEAATFNAVVNEAAEEGSLGLVAYAACGLANTFVEHLARLAGTTPEVLIAEAALAVQGAE